MTNKVKKATDCVCRSRKFKLLYIMNTIYSICKHIQWQIKDFWDERAINLIKFYDN